MKKILKEETIEFIEKKSKFIGYIKPVNSISEALSFIDKIKKEHSNATHNVPLYRVIENGQEYFKYNDDGEPSGTAAKPMADIVERKEIFNIAMVATRYFGGIKLGAGGLIRNYARVAKELIDVCEIIDYIEKKYFILSFEYNLKNLIDRIIDNNNLEIIEQSFLDKINMKLLLSENEIKLFKEIKDIEIIEI